MIFPLRAKRAKQVLLSSALLRIRSPAQHYASPLHPVPALLVAAGHPVCLLVWSGHRCKRDPLPLRPVPVLVGRSVKSSECCVLAVKAMCNFRPCSLRIMHLFLVVRKLCFCPSKGWPPEWCRIIIFLSSGWLSSAVLLNYHFFLSCPMEHILALKSFFVLCPMDQWSNLN